MRVLVTGAGGLIGRWAVDDLVRAGHHVVALVRETPTPVEGLIGPQETVVTDVRNVPTVRAALESVEGVVHLAAIPAPVGHTTRELLEANTISTVTILEEAGERGVRGAVIASSISILGMAWSERLMAPLYLPIDEEHPLRPTEGYALSKECDEAAGRMAARRWGMGVKALRFPFTNTWDVIRSRASDPAQATVMAKELWAYLDVRDAARAIRLALESAVRDPASSGTVLNIMADDVLPDRDLPTLLSEWHPGVDSAQATTLRGAYDVSRAEQDIEFRARHLIHATL